MTGSRVIGATPVTPFVGVWIETGDVIQNQISAMSHPSWVCGLKLIIEATITKELQSHPSWVCGLKLPCAVYEMNPGESHPSWVCGLKLLLPR